MWLLIVIVGVASAMGLLVGLAMIAAVYALALTVRLIVWIVSVTFHLGRAFFAPVPPSNGPNSST